MVPDADDIRIEGEPETAAPRADEELLVRAVVEEVVEVAAERLEAVAAVLRSVLLVETVVVPPPVAEALVPDHLRTLRKGEV
jgi:hypothetical protein